MEEEKSSKPLVAVIRYKNDLVKITQTSTATAAAAMLNTAIVLLLIIHI